ncbi:MAG: aa3-type cytochrome c oxidase subunit IV [Acetobacteraceae bacterium]
MSDHSHAAQPPTRAETPEAFLADRQNFWNGFTQFTLWSTVSIIILLVAMAVFLL